MLSNNFRLTFLKSILPNFGDYIMTDLNELYLRDRTRYVKAMRHIWADQNIKRYKNMPINERINMKDTFFRLFEIKLRGLPSN